MPLLIEGLCPQLTAEIINQCKKAGIHTVSEFVSANTEELSKTFKIPYKELVYIRHSLLSNYGCFSQRADSLYSMMLETMHVINIGSKRINSFLNGGIYTGEVTEFYGSPGSGKTQLCLSTAACLVSESDSNTMLYLDSNGNFSAGRIKQILMTKYAGNQVPLEELHRIRVINIQDIYNLLDILETVKRELCNPTSQFFKYLKVIAIDSVTHLLSPCFGGKYLDGPGFMGTIAHLFKGICSDHMIAILVTNNTVQSESQDIKAGLGPNWKYVPSVSLCISKVSDIKTRKLSIMKSCRNGLYNEITFCISESGIDD